jgi:hypothetical protein
MAYFMIYHKRTWVSKYATAARRKAREGYDIDEQEEERVQDEHRERATEDLHKVTEYLLTKP